MTLAIARVEVRRAGSGRSMGGDAYGCTNNNEYAGFATNWTHGTPVTVSPLGDATCTWWDVQAVGDAQSREAWRRAFGTFEWDHLQGDRAAMLVFGTDVTDATNAFNDELINRVRLAGYTYLVNRPPIQAGGTIWLISGVVDANRQPVSLRSWRRAGELLNPYFIQRPAFRRKLQEFQANDWINAWSGDFAALDAARAAGNWLVSPPFEMAVLSFWDASSSEYLDFRMPALVRTIESLIAIPRGQGAATFAQRAALFAEDVRNHPAFTASGRTLDQLLRDLFQLRSDAVHGKWLLRDLQLAAREDEVALLDFTAEMISRSVIKWALRNRAVKQTSLGL